MCAEDGTIAQRGAILCAVSTNLGWGDHQDQIVPLPSSQTLNWQVVRRNERCIVLSECGRVGAVRTAALKALC